MRFVSRATTITMIGAAALGLSACGMTGKDEPENGKLTHHLTLMGQDGKRYGTVDLDPIGGGKVYDTTGSLVGVVVPATQQ